MIKLKPEEHTHIWKYTKGSNIRVCEPPFPTIPSCGRRETFDNNGKTIKVLNN